jgi:hypothetical protein
LIIGAIIWYLDKLFQMIVEWVKRKI